MSIASALNQPINSTSPLVTRRGERMPPSQSYLQAQQEAERHKRLDDAWRAYTGEVHGQIQREPGQPDPNVISNRAAPIVDTGVDFLTGKCVTLEVLQNGKPQKDAQTALDGCWGNENRRMTTMSKLAQNGGVFGHVFAKTLPPNPDAGRKYCRVMPLDPAQITVQTDPMDCDAVLAYYIQWYDVGVASDLAPQLTVGHMQIIERIDPDDPTGDTYNNEPMDYDEDATWLITNWRRGPNGAWYQVGASETWAHAWAPVVDWQNLPIANQHWGMSDIPPNVQHLNSVLNLTLSNINLIGKHHSFPWLYASGVGLGSVIEVGPGKLTQLQAPEAKLQAVEAHGDVAGMLNYAADLRSDMDEQTRVPSIATGRMAEVPKVTSGVAFQMMYGPLLSKTTHKQRLYSEGLSEISLRMLSLCGFGDGTGQDGWEVKAHWPSPLPNDDQATAQLVLAAEQVGMSQHYICKLLDVDYDEEMEYRKQEAKEQMKAALQGAAMPGGMSMKAPGLPGMMGQGQGQGMPPAVGQPGAADTSAQASSGPPVNHPAAVAARQAASAVGKAIKAGGR